MGSGFFYSKVMQQLVMRSSYYLGLAQDQGQLFLRAAGQDVEHGIDAFLQIKDQEKEEARTALSSALEASIGVSVKKARAGDLTTRVEDRFNDRELDGIAHNLNGLLSVVDDGVQRVKSAAATLAEGKLNARIEGQFKGAFAELQQSFDQSVASVA